MRDLLGGTGYLRNDNDFWEADGRVLQPGDRFDYYNTNTVDWLGAFAQGEYAMDTVTAYAMAGYSTIRYAYEDHFRDGGSGAPFKTDSDRIGGYQAKGGASYSLSRNVSVFSNVGLVSRVPIFNSVINNVTGIVNPNPHNERFLSLKAGATLRPSDRTIATKINAYHTS